VNAHKAARSNSYNPKITLIRKTLNWKPRALEETFLAMAESMIELKLI